MCFIYVIVYLLVVDYLANMIQYQVTSVVAVN